VRYFLTIMADTIYVRSTLNPSELAHDARLRERLGPKAADHPTVGAPCPACQRPLDAGDYTTCVALGPGDDAEQRAKAREGRWYTAVAVELHWACATGEQDLAR
jgi:hypothetical protein